MYFNEDNDGDEGILRLGQEGGNFGGADSKK